MRERETMNSLRRKLKEARDLARFYHQSAARWYEANDPQCCAAAELAADRREHPWLAGDDSEN